MRVVPDLWDLGIYLVGWSLGWLLLWRVGSSATRPRDAGRSAEREPIAVVIPARNEATVLPHLLGAVIAQQRPGDEIVVVDDHSDDETAAIASRAGARVVASPPLPTGWLGKPHACWVGANATTAPVLLFLDADVVPAPDILDRVGTEVNEHWTAVISVQPWHRMERLGEQASALFNITASMASGAFTALGDRVTATMAFGPVLALRRREYERIGGHANPTIRSTLTEDIAIARAVGRSRVSSGRPDTTYRMYPEGIGQTLHGWTRTIATGARQTPWWLAIATATWLASMAGGWLAAPILYPLSAVQMWVLGRRVGSIHPATALLFPVALVLFVAVFLRSLVLVLMHRSVDWKGRKVPTR